VLRFRLCFVDVGICMLSKERLRVGAGSSL
jgi:hypothetical protein